MKHMGRNAPIYTAVAIWLAAIASTLNDITTLGVTP